MTTPLQPLSGNSSIAQWLDSPRGNQVLSEALREIGQNVAVLKPLRPLALKRLIPMSQGRLTPELIDQLAAKANGDA